MIKLSLYKRNSKLNSVKYAREKITGSYLVRVFMEKLSPLFIILLIFYLDLKQKKINSVLNKKLFTYHLAYNTTATRRDLLLNTHLLIKLMFVITRIITAEKEKNHNLFVLVCFAYISCRLFQFSNVVFAQTMSVHTSSWSLILRGWSG